MWEKVVERIVSFIRDYVKSSDARGVVVGISGGVDSATTAFLCVRALGNERVLGLIMPEKGVTREEDVEDALEVCKILGIKYKYVEINPMVEAFLNNLEDGTDIAKANVRPRIRMIINYFYANSLNYLVAGTGNKSELMTGYFCYDERTRVLTTEGLKTYKELKPGDIVFSLNPNTGKVEEVPVKAVYTFNYDGEMISIKGKRTDLLVTPNHRMLVVNRSGKLVFTQAVEFLKKRHGIPIPTPWDGYTNSDYIELSKFVDQSCLYRNANVLPERMPTDAFFYLMGLYIGDGTCTTYEVEAMRKTTLSHSEFLNFRDECGRFVSPDKYRCKKSVRYKAHSVYFSIPKGDKARESLINTLETLDIRYRAYRHFVRINSKALYDIFKQCGTNAKNKRIPRWVLEYPADKLFWLYKGLMDSDCWYYRNYQTISRQLALDMVELCAKLGMHATISVREPRIAEYNGKIVRSQESYLITVANRIRTTSIYPERVSKVYYRGVVWCPDVPPYHNLLVERNGKFTFCGNTKYGDGGVDFLPIGDLYKTEVWELARFLGVPKRIVKKTPSAGLWIGQTDEGEMGITYVKLDTILKALERGYKPEEIPKKFDVSEDDVKRVLEMVEKSRHKREMPPIVGVRDLIQ
ncbi:NAD(+) synthase [Archaeoglobus sp.]